MKYLINNKKHIVYFEKIRNLLNNSTMKLIIYFQDIKTYENMQETSCIQYHIRIF